MRLSQVLLLLAGLSPLALPASDEATILAQVRQLQAAPDPQRRAWLESLLDHQPRQTKSLQESRERIVLPRYPIAAAARSALRELDIDHRVRQLSLSDHASQLPAHGDDLEIAAWCRWLEQSAGLPAPLTDHESARNWPESLLLCAARHAPASALTSALLRQAEQGASLRWLDGQLSQISLQLLLQATSNPALASAAWREMAARANRGDQQADQELQQAALATAEQPGAPAGLARWGAGPELARSLLDHPAPLVQQRARLTLWQTTDDPAQRARLLDAVTP